MKRTLLMLGMAFATMAVWAQSTGWSAGMGTLNDPYQISNLQDLQALATDVNAGKTFNGIFFKLTSDIDLSKHFNAKLNKSWTPIGNSGNEGFAGVLDGDNHVITGLYIYNKDDKQALFGFINGGTVKNLVLKDCNVTANSQVAGIAGMNSGTISNCSVLGGAVHLIGSFGDGGMIAGNCKNGAIDGCYVERATLSGNYSCNIGLIVGKANGSLVSNSNVKDSELSGGVHKGAILGYNGGKMKLEKNYYSANIKGAKGGCDDKDINNPKNPEGAIRIGATSTIATSALVVTAPNVFETNNNQSQPQNKTYTEDELWPSASPQTTNVSTGSQESELWPSSVPSEKAHTVQKPAQQPSAVTAPAKQDAPTKQETPAGKPNLITNVEALTPAKVAPNSSYIVKTKGVQPVVKMTKVTAPGQIKEEEVEPADFMGKNFRYVSMCDWKKGMRFMVIPEKYDLLVNTFCDAVTGKEVSSSRLRHKIMVYKGHEDMPNGRVHVNFSCEDEKKNYYYELPNGTFDDYCFGKMGVPTLAYLGDVDKARELLMNQMMLTRTEFFREDTEWDGNGYKEVRYPKNKVVTVKAVGVGTRSFPVKIIVEDEDGNQFYQNVAMSKINSGMRDDEFSVDNEKFLFQGSFEFTGGEMAVSTDIRSYLNQTVHTIVSTSMSSKGSGKVRDVKVPRFTGFIIDEINSVKDSRYYTLTLRETETRRIYYKDVLFSEKDLMELRDASKDDYFGYIFGMGEGALRNTSLETRTAIREGRVIPGMSEDEVLMAVGEPLQKTKDSNGVREWIYNRSNGVLLVVQFNAKGKVSKAGGRATKATKFFGGKKAAKTTGDTTGDKTKNGTPLEN